MRTSRVIAAALSVPIALALGGCASPGATPAPASADDPVIWYDWDADSPAMLALLTTTLELKDGCLIGTGDTYLAFPRSLGSWDAETQTLEYGGASYGVGDTINAGGGGGSLPDNATVPAACDLPEGGSVWLVQTTSLG